MMTIFGNARLNLTKYLIAIFLIGPLCSVGFIAVLLLYISYQTSFDDHITDRDEKFRIEIQPLNQNPFPIAPSSLKSELAPFMVSLGGQLGEAKKLQSILVQSQGGSEAHVRVSAIDADAREILALEIYSTEERVVNEVSDSSIALSEALFKKIDVRVGDRLLFGDRQIYIIGYFKTPPSNSHIGIDGIVSTTSIVYNRMYDDKFVSKDATLVDVSDTLLYLRIPRNNISRIKNILNTNNFSGLPPGTGLILVPIGKIHLRGISGFNRSAGNKYLIELLKLTSALFAVSAFMSISFLVRVHISNHVTELWLVKTLGATSRSQIYWVLGQSFKIYFICVCFIAIFFTLAYVFTSKTSGINQEFSGGLWHLPLLSVLIFTLICIASFPVSVFIKSHKTAPLEMRSKIKGPLNKSLALHVSVVLQGLIAVLTIGGAIFSINLSINNYQWLRLEPKFHDIYIIDGDSLGTSEVQYNFSELLLEFGNRLQKQGHASNFCQLSTKIPNRSIPSIKFNAWNDLVEYRSGVIYMAPSCIAVLGIQITEGSIQNVHLHEGSTKSGMISSSLAHKLWPGQSPIGRQLNLENGIILEIVATTEKNNFDFLHQKVNGNLYVFDTTKSKALYVKSSDLGQLTQHVQKTNLSIAPTLPFRTSRLSEFTKSTTRPLRTALQLSVLASVVVGICTISAVLLIGMLVFRRERRTLEIYRVLGANRLHVGLAVNSKIMLFLAIGCVLGGGFFLYIWPKIISLAFLTTSPNILLRSATLAMVIVFATFVTALMIVNIRNQNLDICLLNDEENET